MHAILNAAKMTDKETSHKYLREILRFPDYYGNNLDALYDCLSEMNDLHIHLIHTESAGEYFPKVMSVFDDLEGAEIEIIESISDC